MGWGRGRVGCKKVCRNLIKTVISTQSISALDDQRRGRGGEGGEGRVGRGGKGGRGGEGGEGGEGRGGKTIYCYLMKDISISSKGGKWTISMPLSTMRDCNLFTMEAMVSSGFNTISEASNPFSGNVSLTEMGMVEGGERFSVRYLMWVCVHVCVVCDVCGVYMCVCMCVVCDVCACACACVCVVCDVCACVYMCMCCICM